MKRNRKPVNKTNIQVTEHLDRALATLKAVDQPVKTLAEKPTTEWEHLEGKLTPKPFLTLLGDSSIDNNGYVSDGQDVTNLVKDYCPDWEVIKLATDGAIIQSVARQTGWGSKVWSSDRSAVLSVGGNDAVKLIRRLTDDVDSTFLDAMVDLTADVMRFSIKYNGLVQSLRGSYKHLALCTIYKPNFADRALNEVATTLLPSFNQVIRDAAREYNCVLIDNFSILRPGDIVYNIEPGETGSRRIAGAIAAFARQVAPKKEQECPKSLPA